MLRALVCCGAAPAVVEPADANGLHTTKDAAAVPVGAFMQLEQGAIKPVQLKTRVPAHCAHSDASANTTTRATADSPSEMEIPASSGSRSSRISRRSSGVSGTHGMAARPQHHHHNHHQQMHSHAGAPVAWHTAGVPATQQMATPFSSISAQLMAGASFLGPRAPPADNQQQQQSQQRSQQLPQQVHQHSQQQQQQQQLGAVRPQPQTSAPDPAPTPIRLAPIRTTTSNADNDASSSVFELLAHGQEDPGNGPLSPGSSVPPPPAILQPVASSPALLAAAAGISGGANGTSTSGRFHAALKRSAASTGALRRSGDGSIGGGRRSLLKRISGATSFESLSAAGCTVDSAVWSDSAQTAGDALQRPISSGNLRRLPPLPSAAPGARQTLRSGSFISTCSSSTGASLMAAAHTRASSQSLPGAPSTSSARGAAPPGSSGSGSRTGSSQLSLSSMGGDEGPASSSASRAGLSSSIGEPPEAGGEGAEEGGNGAVVKRQRSGLAIWRRRGVRGKVSGQQLPDPERPLDPTAPVVISERFARAFLAALEVGDVKWASSAPVASLFDPNVRLVALDKTLHVGKLATLRRLNVGMEQLVKMLGAYLKENGGGEEGGDDDRRSGSRRGSGSGAGRYSEGGGSSQFDLGRVGEGAELAVSEQAAAPSSSQAAADGAAGQDQDGGSGSGDGGSGAYSAALKKLAVCAAPPTLDITCTDPVGHPGSVRVLYGFKFGIRRFTFRDDVVVKGGLIVRMRRARG